MQQGGAKPFPIRAAQYVRMSTDLQRYSIEYQIAAISEYAARNGIEIVRTYEDRGRSGLSFEGRAGLRSLIADVVDRECGFEAIIVYDVSRWGRFQNTDESAYYEYICSKAGVRVIYCAEAFENDNSPAAAILKTLKRAMAAEYSRELAVRIFAGQIRVVLAGFKPGGPPGYGLRRMLVRGDGSERQLLGPGDRKGLQTDRVILIPGPPEEVAVVRRIFRWFADGKGETDIATALNKKGIKNADGREWNGSSVHHMLTSPRYIGHSVYNRVSRKMGSRRTVNPPSLWTVNPDAFTPLITPEVFYKAQARIAARLVEPTDEDRLDHLRKVLAKHGRITAPLIRKERGPSLNGYITRFGSLYEAYLRVGYQGQQTQVARTKIASYRFMTNLLSDLQAALTAEGLAPTADMNARLLHCVGGVSLKLTSACSIRPSCRPYWRFKLPRRPRATLTAVACLHAPELALKEFILFSADDYPLGWINIQTSGLRNMPMRLAEDLPSLAKLVSELSTSINPAAAAQRIREM